MTKAGRGDKGGQAPDMEEDGEEKSDPAEVLAEYFHETMSNLAWLASAVKNLMKRGNVRRSIGSGSCTHAVLSENLKLG